MPFAKLLPREELYFTIFAQMTSSINDAMTHKSPKRFELEKRWFTAEGIPGVNYGQTGVVVALRRIEPEPSYVLELSDGKSIVLSQSELDPTGASAGRTLVQVKSE